MLTLDDDLRIASRTAASQAWLDVLLPPGQNAQAIPASVYNVAAQLLAVEAGVDDHPASARVHLTGGFWLTLRAARLSSDVQPDSPAGAAPSIAVTIEEASAADRLDLFGRAFGLTARERQLLGLLATGSDTRTMARQMSLSEHTVTDHLKSIFAKTGARDRVTVLSRALGTRRISASDPRQAPGAQPGQHLGAGRRTQRVDEREQGLPGQPLRLTGGEQRPAALGRHQGRRRPHRELARLRPGHGGVRPEPVELGAQRAQLGVQPGRPEHPAAAGGHAERERGVHPEHLGRGDAARRVPSRHAVGGDRQAVEADPHRGGRVQRGEVQPLGAHPRRSRPRPRSAR